MLRALCIGIDDYAAPASRLSCCVADARAIGSLLEDTHGDDRVTLLLDQDATLDRISAELTVLASADVDDLVIVSFSGHGTTDHRLVPVDVDINDLEGSCLSLDDLARLLERVSHIWSEARGSLSS